VQRGGAITSFDLLGGGPLPVLWTVEDGNVARLHWLMKDKVQTVDVSLAPADPARNATGPTAAAAAHAIEKVRVLYGPGVALSERSYDALAARAAGDPVGFMLPRVSPLVTVQRWLEPPLTILLLFTIIASLRRRREMQETMEVAGRLPLAPFGRRLLAGLIDALPVFGTLAVVGAIANRKDDPAEFLAHSVETQAAMLAALLIYLLHTTVSETFFGRTLGKLCCGLRVVSLDGQRPPVGALLIRNLLRLIDLSMMFFPLVLVLYSPLRQRAGDVAAGTLVVLNKEGAETVSAEESPEGATTKPAEPVELTE
jgi:uncharacterized RDD family membrane protein YckC